MKIVTTWNDLGYSTANGYAVELKYQFSTYEENKYKELKAELKEQIGTCIISEADDEKADSGLLED